MTTFKNLIATGILAVMSIVSIASTSLNIVKANNYTDSPYSFSFDYNWDSTEVREKQDASAAYMTCISCDVDDYGYYASVYGCNGYNRENAECCSYEYSYSEGITRYHSNWVKSKHDYAYFRAYSNNVVGYTGLWSPDNYNCYD